MTKEKPRCRTLSEIKALSEEYAISVSPYPQDKGAKYDTARKAFEAGYRAALMHHQHGIRKG